MIMNKKEIVEKFKKRKKELYDLYSEKFDIWIKNNYNTINEEIEDSINYGRNWFILSLRWNIFLEKHPILSQMEIIKDVVIDYFKKIDMSTPEFEDNNYGFYVTVKFCNKD